MNLQIGEKEASEFLDCLRATINQQLNRASIRPYDDDRNAVVFSFDGDMQPFLGNSYGWNRREQRTAFTRIPALIHWIGEIMQTSPNREKGGRVFVDNERAYFVDQLSSQPRHLCNLAWPEDFDVREVRDYWLRLKPKPTLTLRLLSHRIQTVLK